MQDLMKGKRGLIMGVANDHSIAWGIAKALHAQGADLAFTYQGEALGKRVKPLAQSLGATGVQEAIYSLLMMNNGFVCESANITELDPVFADMPIVRKRIDNAKLGTVLSNSFGFGGTNATLVFKRMDA